MGVGAVSVSQALDSVITKALHEVPRRDEKPRAQIMAYHENSVAEEVAELAKVKVGGGGGGGRGKDPPTYLPLFDNIVA